MKEFQFCGEITEYVEIPVDVCETQKEMVKEISDILDNWKWIGKSIDALEKKYADNDYMISQSIKLVIGDSDCETIYVIYKDGSTYIGFFGDKEGKFKRYGIKSAVIKTAYEYKVFGDFAVTDNGDISIDESDIEEYGVYAGQYDVKEQTEETVESVEVAEEVTAPEAEQTENNAESVSETYGVDVKADTSKTDELSGATKMIMVFSPVSEYLRQIEYIDTS